MNELLHSLIQDARLWQGSQQFRSSPPGESGGFAELDRLLDNTGWPRGALSECLVDAPGIGELQLVLPLLKQLTAAKQTVFWLNPPHIPYAPALAREGVDLDQLVIIHTENRQDMLWTMENCLRSPVTGLVMVWPETLLSRDIRRLQLAAEAGNNLCLLFRQRKLAEQSSPAALRLELTPGQHLGLDLKVLKRRGGWPGQSCTLSLNNRGGVVQADISPAPVIEGPWTTNKG